MSWLHWAQPWWLALLPLCGVLLWHRLREDGAKAPPGLLLRHPNLYGLLSAPPAAGFHLWRRAAPALALACAITALAQPQRLGGWIDAPPQGRNIVVLLDTSLTMSLEDMIWNGKPAARLAVVKRVFADFAKARTGDRFGIIAFGSSAATLLPPSFDNATAVRMLERAQVGGLGDNTAIGDAIGLALRQVAPQSGLTPVLILYSDNGASNAGAISPAQAVALARHLGVKIYTVQVGDDPATGETYTVPAYPEPQPDMRLIASTTGGKFFYAASSDAERAAIRTIGALTPLLRPPEGRHRAITPLYPWPLALACLLWLFSAITDEDRR
jgi:Ca-activated chloride channel family protein